VKASEIVKPSNLDDFVRLQISCITEEMEGLRFLARLDHRQNHRAADPVIELLVIYEVICTASSRLAFLVTDQIEAALDLFDKMLAGKEMARELGVAWLELDKGLLLQPVFIPKPWGQEIWYTGIEARGVSQVKSDEGLSPLDWVIAVSPEQLLGQHKTPILLKILDPLPDEVVGDLYFEMHEIKQEVYVVTHVDQQAWPNGEGGIRFGFNQSLRKTFASDEAFKQAYLQAVKNYQQVRVQIDNLLDKQLSPSADSVSQEKLLRKKMENFIAIKNIRLGDVITVPCFTPHSLQHGVRTVEFQTPVYERKILSFAQKVLTQNHWDTEEALKKIDLDVPREKPLTVLEKTTSVYREQVVQFDDFKVERITLTGSTKMLFAKGSYRLLLIVSGEVHIAGSPLEPAQAILLPVCADIEINCVSKTAVFLVAEPL
jgi:mannose-6-phosphate isomerase class I